MTKVVDKYVFFTTTVFHEFCSTELGRLQVFSVPDNSKIRFKYNSLWINIFSGTITWIASFGVNQISIQRYNSLPSVKDAQVDILYCLSHLR